MYDPNQRSKSTVIHQCSSVKYTDAAQKACLHYHRKTKSSQLQGNRYAVVVTTVAESLQLAAMKSPDIEALKSDDLEQVALGLTKQFMDALDIADRLQNIVNASTGAQIALDRAQNKTQDVISNVVNAIIPDNALSIKAGGLVHHGQISEEPIDFSQDSLS